MRWSRARVDVAVLLATALVMGVGPALAGISASGSSFDTTAAVQFDGVVATFTDTTPSQQSATIDWGDGGQPSPGTIACANCPSNSPDYAVRGAHTYAQAGTYTVTVQIADVDQDSATATGSAQVRPPPAADFTVAPASPVTGQTIQFDGSASTGAIARYDWDLSGSGAFGTSCSGSSSSAHAGYSDPGSYRVSLRVTDAAGATSMVSHDVTIADAGAIGPDVASADCGPSASGELAPGLRGPPTVEITAPLDYSYYDRAPASLAVSGKLKAPEGLAQFCLTAGQVEPPTIPVGCNQKSLLSHGTFTDVPVSGFKPGFNYVVAWVKDSIGTVVSADIALTVATSATGLDLRADAMEVTQGIQRTSIPETTPQSYSGVGLAAGGKTVVRLYADAPRVSKLVTTPFVKNVDAALYGYRGGKLLAGSPLLAEEGAHDLHPGTGFSGEFDLAAARANAGGAYTFTLPASWTSGSLKLVGAVNPPDLPPAIAECSSCYGNNQFEIDDVKFTPTRSFKIVSVDERASGGFVPSPETTFGAARAVTPLGDGQLITPPYAGTIDISDLVGVTKGERIAKDRLYDWAIWRDYDDPSPPDTYIGIHDDSIGSSTDADPHGFFKHGTLGFDYKYLATVSWQRPLVAARHELGHILGHPHASRSCGGDSGGQVGEDWPDPEGSIVGIGLDRRGDLSGAVAYPLKVQFGAPASRTGTIAGQWDDLMSYCAIEASAWTSTVNWERELATLAIGAAGARAAGASRRAGPHAAASAVPLLVTGFADAEGAQFTQVEPGPGPAQAPPAAGESRYHLIATDAAGQVLSDTPMRALRSHADPGGVWTSLFTEVPDAGIASVAIASGAQVLATRTRSAHPPTVAITTPRPGGLIGRKATVPLSWRASDPDGDPLSVRVEYSRDGGRTWRPVLTARDTGHAILPRRYFAASRNARIRVVANDDFNVGQAVSGRLRSFGEPPAVAITSPGRRERITAGATLYLAGTAFDDTGRALTGRRLRWLAGGRLLGRGGTVSAAGLPAGSRRITLEARDASGRVGRGSVVVAVRAAAPRFVVLGHPKRIGRRARSLRLRVAASIPARLTAGRARFAVSRAPRTIAISIRPGRGPLVVHLALRAGRKVARVRLAIPRH